MVETHAAGKLLRILGLGFGLAAVVGGMVGQGILRTPGIVAAAVHTPGMILLLWLVGALFAGTSAFAYAELGTAIPCTGGPYDFVRRAFGPVAGVVTGWAAWLDQILSLAMLSVVLSEFLHRLGVLPDVGTSLIAVGVISLFWALNWTGTRLSAGSQIVFSAIKGTALLALVVVLFAHPARGAASEVLSGAVGLAAMATAMRVIISTYNGWQGLIFFSEELERPERTLPGSMATGIVSVAALYLLVNVAMLHVLSPAQMAGSSLPAADAAKLALGGSGELALTAFAVLSLAAICNLAIMKSTRIAFALSRGGYLPERLCHVALNGTPRAALTASVVFAAAFASTGTYRTILAAGIPVSMSLVILVNLSAARLRQKEPNLPRPFRMPLFPLPVAIAIAGNLALLAALIFEDILHSLEGFMFLGSIGLIYSAVRWVRTRSEALAAGEPP